MKRWKREPAPDLQSRRNLVPPQDPASHRCAPPGEMCEGRQGLGRESRL